MGAVSPNVRVGGEIFRYQEEIARAVKQGWPGSFDVTIANTWSMTTALLYSLTVITTIGELRQSIWPFRFPHSHLRPPIFGQAMASRRRTRTRAKSSPSFTPSSECRCSCCICRTSATCSPNRFAGFMRAFACAGYVRALRNVVHTGRDERFAR